MKAGWHRLNARVRIPPFVFWPLFLAVFSYLFFMAEIMWCGPGPTCAQTWAHILRECGSILDAGVFASGLAVVFVVFGTLVLATVSFVAAWVPAAVVGTIITLATRIEIEREGEFPAASLGTTRRLISLSTAILVGICIPLFWARVPYEPIRNIMYPFEELAWVLSFAALYVLVSLVLTALYRKHQDVAAWERILFLLYLGLCLAIGIPFSITKYMWREQAEAELERMQVQMEREMAKMKALHFERDGVDVQARLSNLDESSQHWKYSLVEWEGNATLSMNGVMIVFDGVKCGGVSAGGIQIAGPGQEVSSTGTGSRSFSTSYRNGVAAFTFAGHSFTLRNRGRILTIGEQEIILSADRPTLLVLADGTVRMQGPEGSEQVLAAPK